MQKVISKDGTQIAFDRQGKGPAVILVEGAFGFRSFGVTQELAKLLAPHFTVYSYDRRGRGDSENTRPFAVEREVEDIEALIQDAGNSAYLYGISSGACLALEAAIRLGESVQKLALYDAPYNSGDGAQKAWRDYTRQLTELLTAGRRGDAAALFMTFVGTPSEQVEGMRHSPSWPIFVAVAPTLAYDAAVIGEDQLPPTGRAASVTASTLVMNGGSSIPFMYDTAKVLAKAIPHAQHRTLEGRGHDVSAEALAPVLIEFFKS